jgi:hypothetical protein
MHHLNRSHLARGLALVSLLALGACSSSSSPGTTGGTGGRPSGTGGNNTGTGGAASGTGGSSTGTGGSSTGTGGTATGAGGSSSGGTIGTGGRASGGSSGSGGATGTRGATGGSTGNGGAGGHVSGTGGAGGGGNSAGAPGSGGSGGGSSGSCKYKLCEDFESSTVGSIPTGWTSFKGYNNTIGAMDQAVAMDAAHGGTKSLKSIAASQGTARIQRALSGLGATASKHWGRIFYKVQSPSAIDNATNESVLHTTFVSLMGGTIENRIVDTVEKVDRTHQWLFNAPDDMCCTASQYNWKFDDSWHCVEWYVEATTKNQQGQVNYRFFSDSQEVTDIALSNRSAPELPAMYDTIILGATYYQHDTLTGPFTMWFDDLAINDTQIGCQ